MPSAPRPSGRNRQTIIEKLPHDLDDTAQNGVVKTVAFVTQRTEGCYERRRPNLCRIFR